MFASFKMKCPGCRVPLDAPAPECPSCALAWSKLDQRFGVAPKHGGRLTDLAGALSPNEKLRLHARLRLFRRKFPQLMFSVFLLELPAQVALGEYIFWLANRLRFSASAATGENNFDLLLLVNLGADAGLTIGYGLENYLREEDLLAALEAGRAAWRAGRCAEGIERCLARLTERLRELARLPEEKK